MRSSTVEHCSHRGHPLVLKQDVAIGADAACSVCNKLVIGSPTYTCSSDDIDCQNFYLHKSCFELPDEIRRYKQDVHPLVLLPSSDFCSCDICCSKLKFSYKCKYCDFDLCVACAFDSSLVSEQKVIRHQGHGEHTLKLLRQALFRCDACWEEESKDYSYVCWTCDFWIHEKCAFTPPIIPDPAYHHHPLNLIFSIPVMHRCFARSCPICNKRVQVLCWSYYCHKCTFFVHLKCSTSTVSLVDEIEENGIDDNEPHLVQFPLPGEESIFDLISTQCSKFQVKTEGGGEYGTSISTILTDPHIIEEHWSHRDHPLELHQFTVTLNDNNDGDDDDDDRRVLICNGCVQPITVSHPRYYACIKCGFFLHSLCANNLPLNLPAGSTPFHPQHPLCLCQEYKLYSFVKCGICVSPTNGFHYVCKTCDIKIDIRCAFLPTRIRHKSHKQHSLILQRPSPNKLCSVSRTPITETLGYACETCTSFQIRINTAFYPSRMKHTYDDHSLILRHPPFFYEGVCYCQICEEEVNNQWWLYHCDECDQSFHEDCLRPSINVKVGGTIQHSIDNQPHTLALVLKTTTRFNNSPYICDICRKYYDFNLFFECEGCGYLACIQCIRRIHGE